VLVAAGGREVVLGASGRLGLIVFVVGRADGAGAGEGGGGGAGSVVKSVVTSVVTAVLTGGGGACGGAGSDPTVGTLVVVTGCVGETVGA
jgi:hypothetical protein